MTIEDIQRLIAGDETRTLELKKTTGELKDAMHSACAFLNADGGWLIFGIAPKSLRIIGQQVTDATRQEIANALVGLEPAVDVRVEYIDVPDSAGNQVIAMHFDGWVWGMRPYTYHGCPYLKVESTTKQMPREMFEDRINAAQPQQFAWERQEAKGFGIADLDEERIAGVVRLGVQSGRMPASAITDSTESVLMKWSLISNEVPTNGAIALFGKRLDGYPQMMLKMARFRGKDKSEFIDNQSVDGNFFELLDAGMAFLFKHLSLSGKVVGLMREEHLEIPAEALREALTNALCHRQYERYNLFPSIAIYDDRVEIDNPGRLPRELTVESLKLPHKSFPYNLLMAKVLFMSTFLESWGSGIRRMIDFCTAQGVREPEFVQDGSFMMIRFWRSEHENEHENEHEDEHEKLSEREQKILDYISQNPQASIPKMAASLGMSVSTLRRTLQKMAHLVRHEGPDKGGRWIIAHE